MNTKSDTHDDVDKKAIEQLMHELQDERDALDSIMENTNAQLAYLDLQFNFIKVNSAYVQGSGKTRNELIANNHFELFPNAENQKLFESVRDSGQPIEYHAKPFEFEDQPERGVTYWDWLLSPVKDKDGQVQGLVLSLRDVTDSHRHYKDSKYLAIKLLALITGSIFLAEAIIMGFFHLLPEFSPLMIALFDAGLLTFVVFPLLYFLLVKPLTTNITKRNQVEQALQEAYEKMKIAIEERTGDLAKINRNLRGEIDDHYKTSLKLQTELTRSKQRENEVLSLLNSAKIVLELDDFRETSNKICQHCREITSTTTGFIALFSENKNEYEIIYIDPIENDGYKSRDKILLSGLAEKVYKSKEAEYDNNFQDKTSNRFLPEGFETPQNVLFAPLFISKDVVGLIGLSNKSGGFTDNDRQLVTAFAELIAIALSKSLTLESLENSEARFRSVAETASEAIINVDKNGNIIFWNKAAGDIFGYTAEEIFNKSLISLMPEKYHNDHLKGINKVISTGKSKMAGKTVELTGLRKNGDEFPVELSLSIWQMGDDLYITGILRDITERKKMQQALLDSKESLEKRVQERTAELIDINEKMRLEILEREKIEKKIELERKRLYTVLDELPASVHLLRQDHSILFANRYFKQQFGEQLQQPCYKILHGQESPCKVCNAFDVFKSGIPDEYEETHANGKLYRIYNYPFTDTDGSSLILQLGIDITDHKKAEDALRKSEERFRILVNSIDDTVFTLDRKKRFLEIYGNLFDRLGIPVQKSLQKSMEKVFDSKGNQNHTAAIQKALDGENVIYEWSDSKDDETRYIQNSISPIFDEMGKADGVVGVARDITEQKKLEKQQVETEKLLMVAEMSAMISHEFRNSLTSVRMILELQFESENLTIAEKNSLSVALSSLNHMEDVVTQLLNFSRPKPMECKRTCVNTIVLESIEFTRPHFEKNNIAIHHNLDKTLPLISLDKDHFKEALINLTLNAIQAIINKNEGNQIREIELKTEKHILKNTLRDVAISEVVDLQAKNVQRLDKSELVMDQGISCVLITIKDSGIGIKSANLKRIFNPFFSTAVQGGTGLGLSTVKRTINAHKGIVRVESDYGKGTTFKIYLPNPENTERSV
jgi:PAS domain S-box-containing protein